MTLIKFNIFFFVLVNFGVPECNECGERKKIIEMLNQCRFSTKTIQIIEYKIIL